MKLNKKVISVLIVAAVCRLIWALFVQTNPVSDSFMYDLFARNITEGYGYAYEEGGYTAYWPVGTSAVYSVLYRIFGYTYVPIVVLNVLLGVAIVYLTYRISKRFFDAKSALLAAAILSIWPIFIQFTTILASELIFIALFLFSIEIWYSKGLNRFPRILLWALSLSLSVYVRTTSLPFFFLIPALDFISDKQRSVKSTLLTLMLGFVVAVFVFAPWVARNYRHFDHFILVSTNEGSNLWMGNNPESTGGYMKPAREGFSGEVEKNNYYKDLAMSYIKENPLGYIELCFKRIVITFRAETIGVVWNEADLSEKISEKQIMALKLFSTFYWYIILVLGTIGGILFLKGNWANVWNPIVVSFLFFVSIPILTVGQDRYHMPINPFLAIFAASFLLKNIRGKRRFSESGSK